MTSGAIDATPSGDRGDRAFGLGRRWAFLAAAVLAVIAAVAVVLILTAGGGAKPVDSTYGQLPSWLPKTALPSKPRYEVATPQTPLLSEEQGYTVHAELPTGTADVTAVGPSVPGYVTKYAETGAWPAGKLVPSTFSVTFADVKGTIPISAAAFQVEDAQYHFVRASLSMAAGGTVPNVVRAGQTLTLVVHTKTLEGQGAVAWLPLAGRKTLVAWIYQLELD